MCSALFISLSLFLFIHGTAPFSASADVDTLGSIAPLSPNSPLTTGLSAQAARERGDADNNEDDDWEVARARKEAGGRGDDAGVVGGRRPLRPHRV